MKEISSISISYFISKLFKNTNFHNFKNKNYKNLKKLISNEIEKYYNNYNKNKLLKLNNHCFINFPFYKMGKINSKHLFGIDEIIIFSYYLFNKNKYKIIYDLGANIGLHSLVLSKIGKIVNSYEPYPKHIRQFKKIIKINKLRNIKLKEKAVSTNNTKTKFRIIKDNTTGNHIDGDKKNFYGKTKVIKVKTEAFKNILKKADLIKIDVEGHEKKLILSTKKEDWKNTDAFVEIGNKENAKEIFQHCKKINLKIFSQKKGWKRVLKINEIPKNYKEGSVFISTKERMIWSK